MGSFRHPRLRDFPPKPRFSLTAKVFGFVTLGSFGFVFQMSEPFDIRPSKSWAGQQMWLRRSAAAGHFGTFRDISTSRELGLFTCQRTATTAHAARARLTHARA